MVKVKWNDNWVPFLDCLLQMLIIGKDVRNLILPVGISKLKIDPYIHGIMAQELMDKTGERVFEVHASYERNLLRCGGIEISNTFTNTVARRKAPGVAVTELYKFIRHLPTPSLGISDSIRICIQLALDKYPIHQIKAIEVDSDDLKPIIKYFQDAVEDLPVITADLTYLTKRTDIDLPNVTILNECLSTISESHFVILSALDSDSIQLLLCTNNLVNNGFLIVRKQGKTIDCSDIIVPSGFQLLCVMPVEDETIILCQNEKQRVLGTKCCFYSEKRSNVQLDVGIKNCN